MGKLSCFPNFRCGLSAYAPFFKHDQKKCKVLNKVFILLTS